MLGHRERPATPPEGSDGRPLGRVSCFLGASGALDDAPSIAGAPLPAEEAGNAIVGVQFGRNRPLGTGTIAPELLFAEASNALWAMCRRGNITSEDLAEATDVLKGAPITVPLSMRQLAPSATRLALDLDHPVYDCFYLALSMQQQYPVVTADERFHDKVRAHPYLSDQIVHVAHGR